jgi:hypothetical protein
MEVGTKQLYPVDNGRVAIYTAILFKCDNPYLQHLSLNPGNNCIGNGETAT